MKIAFIILGILMLIPFSFALYVWYGILKADRDRKREIRRMEKRNKVIADRYYSIK